MDVPFCEIIKIASCDLSNFICTGTQVKYTPIVKMQRSTISWLKKATYPSTSESIQLLRQYKFIEQLLGYVLPEPPAFPGFLLHASKCAY